MKRRKETRELMVRSFLPFSIGFPPIEDLRDLSCPGGITPVSDCRRIVLALLVSGDFI